MIAALILEIELRKAEIQNEIIETIYFGGGTPSVLSVNEIQLLLDAIYKNHAVIDHPEITLEANPDDLSEVKIIEFSKSPINRLSIGIQSFFEKDLKLMNRAHNAQEARAMGCWTDTQNLHFGILVCGSYIHLGARLVPWCGLLRFLGVNKLTYVELPVVAARILSIN